MWLVAIKADKNFSTQDRDLIAEFIDNEAHNATEERSFILHDIWESDKFFGAMIEGKKTSAINLSSVLRDNLPYKISYERL